MLRNHILRGGNFSKIPNMLFPRPLQFRGLYHTPEDPNKKNKIECPNCRKIHNLPKDGVNGFNNNYTLIELSSLSVDSLVKPPTPSAPLLSSISTQTQTLIQNHAWWYHETTPENIRGCRDVLIGPSLGMLGFGIYLKSKPPKVHLKYYI